MPKKKKTFSKEVYGTEHSPGRYDVEVARPKDLKRMTKKDYQDYSAQRQRVQDYYRKAEAGSKRTKNFMYTPRDTGGSSRSVFSGRPKNRYYKSTAAGSARYAKRKAKRR